MINKKIIKKYLKDNKIYFDDKSNGLNIKASNNEVLISGSKADLIELCDYILSIALEKRNDHVHIDNLTLINDDSQIKSLIIEGIKND